MSDLSNVAIAPAKVSTSTARVGSGYVRLKTAIEWVVALVLLVLAAPLLAVLAILVRLTSDGPVAYSQLRLGRRGGDTGIRSRWPRTLPRGCRSWLCSPR